MIAMYTIRRVDEVSLQNYDTSLPPRAQVSYTAQNKEP